MKRVCILRLLIVIVLNSCSIKKREYRPGFYFSSLSKNKKHTSKEVVKTKQEKIAKIATAKNDDHNSVNLPPLDVLASVQDQIYLAATLKPLKPFITKDSGCGDVLTLKKGSEVVVKVLEINETQIKYKRCDNLDGPLIIIYKNDVYSIKYRNGYIEHFERILTPSNSENLNSGKKEVHPLALVTLGCTISILFTSLFGLLGALIVAPMAKRKILENPQKYEGLQMVRTCQIVCYALIGLIAVFILIALGIIFI